MATTKYILFYVRHPSAGVESMLSDTSNFSPDYLEKAANQRILWDSYIKKHGWGIEMVKTEPITSLVLGGIPDELRGVYLTTTG